MNVIHTHLSTFTWLREQRSFYGNVLNVLPRQINFSMWWSNFRELFRFQILALDKLLKTSQNKKDLNDVTAAWFLVRFFAAGSWEKDTKNRAAVMSLKSFSLRDDFNNFDSTVLHSNKGQLISKGLFVILNSPKKQTKKFDFTTIQYLRSPFFFFFWEKLKTPKRHFEINGPL